MQRKRKSMKEKIEKARDDRLKEIELWVNQLKEHIEKFEEVMEKADYIRARLEAGYIYPAAVHLLEATEVLSVLQRLLEDEGED